MVAGLTNGKRPRGAQCRSPGGWPAPHQETGSPNGPPDLPGHGPGRTPARVSPGPDRTRRSMPRRVSAAPPRDHRHRD
jgi:hypothetical protein